MVAYDASTALLVIDVQNDFADPKGSLYVRGGERVVPFVAEEIARARRARAPVVYTMDWHPAQTPHFRTSGGIWPPHCVQGTWGAELHPDLPVAGEIIRTGTGSGDGYSGFGERDAKTGEWMKTGLEEALRAEGVTRVVVAGLATDYCVKATALDARRLGFDTTVLTEGTRAVDLQPGDGERALAELARAGVHLE